LETLFINYWSVSPNIMRENNISIYGNTKATLVSFFFL